MTKKTDKKNEIRYCVKKTSVPKKLLTLLLVLGLVVSLSLPVFAAPDSDCRVSPQNWMKQIDDDLTLAQFTIPGTHDSCTQKCVLGRCQHVDVQSQLNYGVRFLDIRLKYENNGMYCYHGFVNCLVSFKTVMEQVSAFLKAHPTECVVMSIKNEGTESAAFENALINDWIRSEKYADLFYTGNAIPTLKNVRGKIVLMRRYSTYDQQLTCGIDAVTGWGGNTTSTMEREAFKIAVQDCYQYDTVGLTFGKNKWKNFQAFDQAMATENADNSANYLWMNFASGCNKVGAGTLSCAEVVNYNLAKEFTGSKRNHGIVIVDFATLSLVKRIYATNF